MEKITLCDLTEELMGVQAPSGREHNLAALLKEKLEPIADECWIDRLGNLIALIRGNGENRKKLLYAAHMDEVSFIVSMIDDDGFVHFVRNGGTHLTSAAYRQVVFENGIMGAVVPKKDNDLKAENMVVDLGIHGRKEAEALVSVGDFFSTVPFLRRFSGSVICGRPIDDRIGCAIQLMAAIELAGRGKRPYNDVYFTFTVQEETALPAIGGLVLAAGVEPDVAIAVDVCQTADTPDAPEMATKCGAGASILVRDTTMLADRELTEEMIDAAKKGGIPYQLLVALEGGTDAVPMQQAGRGCKASILSVPMKYLHTSAEMADLDDAENCLKLLLALCDRSFRF